MTIPRNPNHEEIQETLDALQELPGGDSDSNCGIGWVMGNDSESRVRQSTDQLEALQEDPAELSHAPLLQVQNETRSAIRKLADGVVLGVAATGIVIFYLICWANAQWQQAKESVKNRFSKSPSS